METEQSQQPSKQERREASQRKSVLKKIIIWGTATVAVVGLVAWGIIASKQAEESSPGETFQSQGQAHITEGAAHPEYNSNPPTSGWHYAQPANWGVYQNELPDEQVVHNLEHGGIWISYKDINADTLSKIEDIAKRYSNKLIVTPRAKNDSAIVLASWGRLLKLESFDERIIINFIKSNKNKSPEPFAQ